MEGFTKIAAHQLTFLVIVMSALFTSQTDSSTVQLNSGNVQDILQSNELVFVNFYADWCRFSQLLGPIFDEAARKIKAEFPGDGKVVMGKVDCDRENGIATQYHVSKYPTLKIFRFGSLVKREYRGQRSADAISKFISEQLREPIDRVNRIEDLDIIDGSPDSKSRRTVIGYFDNTDSHDYKTFAKMASMLRDDCKCYAAIGDVSTKQRELGNKVVFRPPNQEQGNDVPYEGQLTDDNLLSAWATDKCVPLVREITFENAEELTEEGLPFLILFHHPDDKETPEIYRTQVSQELLSEKSGVNFLTADGNKFSHPLYHLGKTTNDLPILAIDSFRHMYLWPQNTKENIAKPGLLKQFIGDLHSGKLHREFHHGPDPSVSPPGDQKDGTHMPKENSKDQPPVPTTPPESEFKKLGPSRSRYTLLNNRDEL